MYAYVCVCYVHFAAKKHEKKVDISIDIAYTNTAEPLQIAIGHGCLLLCTY